MRISYFYLLLLVILTLLGLGKGLLAKEAQTHLLKASYPKQNLAPKENLDHSEAITQIKNNFHPWTLIPFLQKEEMEFELGPAQFQIRIPFK